jgi:hypothetical protein
VQLHAEGVIAGTRQADKWIAYVGKYLTKTVDQCHALDTDRQRDHVERCGTRCASNPAHRRARTGCATPCNPKTPDRD